MSRRVAVIGAGVAGLAAGRALAQAGCDVRVYEKARGPGGRIATRRSEGGAFDIGAQYFTCRSEEFRAEVEAWRSAGAVEPWSAPMVTIERGVLSDEKRVRERWVGVPRMSAVARHLAGELQVEVGSKVGGLGGGPGRWQLVCESGPLSEPFEQVVVATPAPQAVAFVAASASLAGQLARTQLVPCQAVLWRPASPLGREFGGAFVVDSPLSWVSRDSSKPGRGEGERWVLHAAHEWSARHIDDSPDEVARQLLVAFGEALGEELPETSYVAAHCWRFARAVRSLGGAPLWDARVGIGVCGDWTRGDRLEDAYLSGTGLAAAMLARG